MSGPIFTAYGFTQPLIDINQPIIAQRDPTQNDRSTLGNLWVNKDTNSVFVLTSIVGPVFTWTDVSAGAGDVSSFVTDAGNVNPVAGIVNVLGGSNINTSGAGNTLLVNLNEDVTISGNFTTTGGNISLPHTDSGGIEGIIRFDGFRFIHNIGTDNTYIGSSSGNLSESGSGENVGVGFGVLNSLENGNNNVAIGSSSMLDATDAVNNVAIGSGSGQGLTDGSRNIIIGFNAAIAANCSDTVAIGTLSLNAFNSTGSNIAIGPGALINLIDGENNVVLGLGGGFNYAGTESNNILIQNNGLLGESNTIRIGKDGSGSLEQNKCFIAGIIGNTVSNTEFVTIDTITGQLGTSPTPSGALTWQVVTSATPLVPGNGYIVNGGSTLQFTLPVTAVVGDTMEILILNTAVGGWQINQNASQYLIANGPSAAGAITTPGVTGNVATTVSGNFLNIKVTCVIANTAFTLTDIFPGMTVFT